ncbi:hypothetical protein FA014_19320, partial [Cellulomonas hominis]
MTGTSPADGDGTDDLRVLAVALHDLSRAVRQAQGAQQDAPGRLPPTEFEVMRYVDAALISAAAPSYAPAGAQLVQATSVLPSGPWDAAARPDPAE